MMGGKKALRLLSSSRFHFYATIVWILLLIPTVVWWSESILWIGFISIYANVISHWTAYQASHTEEAMKKGKA